MRDTIRPVYAATTEVRKLSRREMLLALSFHSKNELCASIARRIIMGTTTVEEQLKKNPGSFIRAVLEDDYETALSKADCTNKEALTLYLKEIQEK